MYMVSIQVVSGCSVSKNWGIHNVVELSTVCKVYVAPRDGTLEGAEYFEFPVELQDQPYRSIVGKSQTAELQTVVVMTKTGHLIELFGRYVKYLVEKLPREIYSALST